MTATHHHITWRVSEILASHKLTTYKLALALSGKVNRNSVYAIATGKAERLDLRTLDSLLVALEQLTGQRYTTADLLTWEPPRDEEGALLEASTIDLRQELTELEKDIDPNEIEAWMNALKGKGA